MKSYKTRKNHNINNYQHITIYMDNVVFLTEWEKTQELPREQKDKRRLELLNRYCENN